MTILGDILRQIRLPGEETGYFAVRGDQRQGFFTADNDLALPQDRDVWFSLNPGTTGYRARPDGTMAPTGRVTRQTVTRLAALHADLDIGGAGKTVPDMAAAQSIVTDLSTMLGTAPIAIIGSGHGYQPIWAIVPEQFAGDEAGELLKRWGALVRIAAENHGGQVDSVFELARLVRAPGSINYKHTPVAATATMLGGRQLALDEIRTTLDAYSPAPEQATMGAANGTYTGPTPTQATTYEINAVNAEIDRLRALPRPWRDGANWDATIYAVATSLTEIANSNWSTLTHDHVEQIIDQYAPYDDAWDGRREKLQSGRRTAGSKGRPAPNELTRGADFITAIAQQQGVLNPDGSPATPAPMTAAGGPRRGWSDVDNGMRVYDATQGKLLWLADAGTWAEWDGKSWDTGVDLADDVAQAVLQQAVVAERGLYPLLDEKTYAKLTASTGAAGGIRAAAVSLKRSRLCTSKLADFDQRADLLRTPNGVINLRDGALLAPSPDMRLLKGTSVAYDPHAQAPEFDRWLKWAQPDQAMRDYLQMAIGIALTGEQVKRYWVHEGAADAGKSMLIKLMTRVLGDAAVPISDSLIEGRSKVFGDDYHRAALRGARLAVLDETRQGGHTLEASIKQLVGGATMVGRNPAERPFQFEPVFKLHIATNNAPMNSPDPAIRNRLALVRWEVGSTEQDRRGVIARLGAPLDTYLMRNELPGILAWAVRGAARWYADGMALGTPAAVSRATDEHIAEGDLVARWLHEETFEKEGGVIGGMQGWTAFRSWKERIGERSGPETMTSWGLEMGRLVELDPSMTKIRTARGIEYRGRAATALAWSPGLPGGV